jgi:hypothetical protein
VGISCVDFYDASENITSSFMDFKDKQWYKLRIRVSDAKLECFIDGEQVVNVPREDHRFTTRIEVDENKPLGISSYTTTGEVRTIRIRHLKPEEIEEAKASAEAER